MAASTVQGTAAAKDDSLPVYPRMTPNTSEAEEWWTLVDNLLNKSDHGWFVRGGVPPWLEKQTTPTDVSALAVLTVPATDTLSTSTWYGIIRWYLIKRLKIWRERSSCMVRQTSMPCRWPV